MAKRSSRKNSGRPRSVMGGALRAGGVCLLGLGLILGWRVGSSRGVDAEMSAYDEGYVVNAEDLPRNAAGEPVWDNVPFVSPQADVPAEITARVQALAEEQARIEDGYIADLELLAFPDLPPDPQ